MKNKNFFKSLFFTSLIMILIPSFAQEKMEDYKPLKIIFQLSTADTLAHKALMKQLSNITKVKPDTKIEVVCHGPGLEILQKSKSVVLSKINDLNSKGINFYACEFSMTERKVIKTEITEDAKYVPAGIIYIVTKQEEGWSYIKSGF